MAVEEEGPKLYANKPKKAQVKQFQEQRMVKEAPAPPASAAAVASKMGSESSSSAPQPPRESFARRYKFLWPMLLTVNLAVGAYLFTRTKKQDDHVEEKGAATDSAEAAKEKTVAVVEDSPAVPALAKPVVVREPIPVVQQRELFKWILEEKRKTKPKDPEEKKRIDQEKAILKQFIRAKSVPNI